MVYSIQNNETGEVDYIHLDLNAIKSQEFDQETGEPLNDKLKVRYVKHKHFQIPKKYLRGTVCDEFESEMTENYHENFKPSGAHVQPNAKRYKRADYINMEGVKNEIILGYNKDNYRLFLIPTLFFFNRFLWIVVTLIEALLHFWAHRKNNLNMNKQVYYRSPLHILTSQFCATCRYDSETDRRVFAMLNEQMRKARKSKTFKDVTKAIS